MSRLMTDAHGGGELVVGCASRRVTKLRSSRVAHQLFWLHDQKTKCLDKQWYARGMQQLARCDG
jgi:hypothetical protein